MKRQETKVMGEPITSIWAINVVTHLSMWLALIATTITDRLGVSLRKLEVPCGIPLDASHLVLF